MRAADAVAIQLSPPPLPHRRQCCSLATRAAGEHRQPSPGSLTPAPHAAPRAPTLHWHSRPWGRATAALSHLLLRRAHWKRCDHMGPAPLSRGARRRLCDAWTWRLGRRRGCPLLCVADAGPPCSHWSRVPAKTAERWLGQPCSGVPAAASALSPRRKDHLALSSSPIVRTLPLRMAGICLAELHVHADEAAAPAQLHGCRCRLAGRSATRLLRGGRCNGSPHKRPWRGTGRGDMERGAR